MPLKRSAGLLMFRGTSVQLEVFLVHPGGPYFVRKDGGAWTVPKGEVGPDEDPLSVARREFLEETGRRPEACARGSFEPLHLGSIRQRGGKHVEVWAFEGDWPEGLAVESNAFEIEWPPRSGKRASFPEVDRGQLFDLETARVKIHPDQAELLDRLVARLEARA